MLSTLFAATAAAATLSVLWQARKLHREDAEERERTFQRELQARERTFQRELQVRQLEQLSRIGELVANVRQTAKLESTVDGGLPLGGDSDAPFFWNARRQLEAALNVLQALGGPDLPTCRELAVGSPMTHLVQVVSKATSAFDELARVARDFTPGRDESLHGIDP